MYVWLDVVDHFGMVDLFERVHFSGESYLYPTGDHSLFCHFSIDDGRPRFTAKLY